MSPLVPKLHPITAADYPELAQFCASFPGEQRSLAFWQDRFWFWWEENPAFYPGFYRGCLLRDGNRLVGLFGLVPTTVRWQGGDHVAANMTCWRVLESHRNHSLSLFTEVLQAARSLPLLNTTPTKGVETILKGIPFSELYAGVQRESLFITRSGWSLNSFKDIFRITRNWDPQLAASSNRITAAAKALGCHLAQETISRLSSGAGGWKVRRVTSIGADFDYLWQRTRDRFGFTNVRSAASLCWYIERNANKRDYYLFAHHHAGALQGYLLFVRRPTHNWPDSACFEALDMWWDPVSEQTPAALIRYAAHFARVVRVQVLRIPHFHPLIALACRSAGCRLEAERTLKGYILFPPLGPPHEINTIYPSHNMGGFGL